MQSCFVKHVQDPCLSSTFSPFLSCKIYDIFFHPFLSVPQKDSSLCHKYYKSIVNLHVVFIEQYVVLKSLKGLIDIQKKSYKSSFNSEYDQGFEPIRKAPNENLESRLVCTPNTIYGIILHS